MKKVAVFLLALSLSGCAVTPDPLSHDDIQQVLNDDLEKIKARQIPVTKPITLYEAMARTVASNLSYQVQVMEREVAAGQMKQSRYDMFPKLSAGAQHTARAPERASVSQSVRTREVSLEASTSEDRSRYLTDMSFSWDLLDFGASYYQAKQEANRVLIAEELHRKALHDLMNSVRSAFWRAAAAQELQDEIDELLLAARHSLQNARQVEIERLKPPLEVLRFQKSLMDVIRQMENLYSELDSSKTELRNLMNLPHEADMRLVVGNTSNMSMPRIDFDVAFMEEMALLQRPELREEIYRERIDRLEVKRVILQALPGIQFRASYNYDSNSFLVDNWWAEASQQITGNLIQLFSIKTRVGAAKSRLHLTSSKRMALYLTIISQVNLAIEQYKTAVKQLERSAEISRLEKEILKLVTINTKNDAEIELERIRTAAAEINSRLQRFQAYAEAQNAIGRILVSVGFDPVSIFEDVSSLDDLSSAIEDRVATWEEGNIEKAISDFKAMSALPPPGRKPGWKIVKPMRTEISSAIPVPIRKPDMVDNK